mgnify:CR=1 FL=1
MSLPNHRASLSMKTHVISLILLALWALWAFGKYRTGWGGDLAALIFAGHYAAQGQLDLIYAAPPDFFGGTPPEWLPLRDALGLDQSNSVFPYIYPPLWAGLVAPLAEALSPHAFQQGFLGLNVLLLAGCVLLAEQIARPVTMSPLVFRLWSIATLAIATPTTVALGLNQPSIIVAFLILLGAATMVERPVLSGTAIAVASAIKLTPLVFVAIYFLLPRENATERKHALIAFSVVSAVLAGASILLMGWPLHRAFLDQLDLASGKSIWSTVNPSARILILDLGHKLGLSAPLDPSRASQTLMMLRMPLWPGLIMGGIAVLLGARAFTLARSRHGADVRGIAFLGMSIGLFLFGPLSWLHYLIVPLLLAPALIVGMSRSASIAILALILIANSNPVLNIFAHNKLDFLPYTALIVTIWALALGLTLRALAYQPRD